MRIEDGVFVNGIRAWHVLATQALDLKITAAHVIGLEVLFTDGKSTMIGSQDSDLYAEATWNPAEKSVEWMTGADEINVVGDFEADTWMNRFEFMLSDGTHFCAGGNGLEGPTGCTKEKPSDPRHSIGGTLLGLGGALGQNGIEAIVAYFLRSDHKNVEVHDVVLSPSIEELNSRPAGERGLTQSTLMIGHCLNDLESGPVTFNLAKDAEFSVSKTVTQEVSDAWHIGTSIAFEYSFGVPAVANKKITATQEFSWTRTNTKSNSQTEGTKTVVKWGASVVVQPGKAVRVAGYSVEGKVDVTWTGKMTLTLQTGEKVTFPTGGILKDTFYSDSYTVIDEEDPEKARLDVLSGDGNFVDPNGNPLSPPVSKRMGRRFIA